MSENLDRWKKLPERKEEAGGMSKGTGVGMASILLIVIVLAFTTFGILSLVSALSDVRMSGKAHATAAAYYLPVLLLSGVLTGMAVGAAAAVLIRRIPPFER